VSEPMKRKRNSGLTRLTEFIVQNGRVPVEGPAGEEWYLRQPMPEELADGKSAYRVAYDRVMNDRRLRDLAGNEANLKREANKRGAAAELVYMLPLLLEDEGSAPVFDIADAESMEAYDNLSHDFITQTAAVYWGPITTAMIEAKKKSKPALRSKSQSVSGSGGGLFRTRLKPGRKRK